MALWVCTGCTTAYAVGAVRCPQCGSTEHVEQGEAMPKITVHGGATNAAEEESWPGSSSSTSSEKPSVSPETSETETPSPARTTGSRSKRARTESRTARQTGGDREAGTSETGSADA